MNPIDAITLLYHTYDGAGYSGGGGGWASPAYIDPETVMVVTDAAAALF